MRPTNESTAFWCMEITIHKIAKLWQLSLMQPQPQPSDVSLEINMKWKTSKMIVKPEA